MNALNYFSSAIDISTVLEILPLEVLVGLTVEIVAKKMNNPWVMQF